MKKRRDIPPNHLLVEPRYYHSDGSKITLFPWPRQYHCGGSKKSSIAQKAQNCQIHSEMEEKKFTATAVVLPWPRKQCNFTSITMVVPRLYLQMIWQNTQYTLVFRLQIAVLGYFSQKPLTFQAEVRLPLHYLFRELVNVFVRRIFN